MYRESEPSGSYPESEPWPEPKHAPADTPELHIAQGISRYTTQVTHALERQTGNRETYLTPEQEFEAAQALERGRRADALIEAGLAADTDMPGLLKDKEHAAAARERLILTNLRLAAFLARASMNILTPEDRQNGRIIGSFGDITKLASPSASLEDRISIANEGLVRAADEFRPILSEKTGKPLRFTTIATSAIHNSLRREVKQTEHSGIRLPSNVYNDLSQARKSPGQFSPEKLAFLTLSRRFSHERYAVETLSSSLKDDHDNDTWDKDQPLSPADVLTNTEDISPERNMENVSLTESLNDILDKMSRREAGVIRMRYGLAPFEGPRTLDQIADAYGVSRGRIHQIELRTMAKLRHPSLSKPLADYLEEDAPVVQEADGFKSLSATEQYTVHEAGRYEVENLGDISAASSEGTTLEPWQTSADEDWDAPVRFKPEFADDETVITLLTGIIRSRFQESFAVQTVSTDTPSFPVDMKEEIHDALRSTIQARHLEAFWNDSLATVLAESDTVDPSRLSLFFSLLLRDTLRDDDEVTLSIPQSLDGKMDYFGFGISHGHVIVDGSLGRHAGMAMNGLGALEVNGSVGDDAGQGMKGYARLLVHGDAGYRFGSAVDTVDTVCEGTVAIDKSIPSPDHESDQEVDPNPLPVAAKRQIARSSLRIASIRSQILAQERIHYALDGLGDDASPRQVEVVAGRIDTLRRDLKKESSRQYWDALRRGTFTSK